MSGPFIGSEDGAKLDETLNLFEGLRLENRPVSAVEKLTQSRHRQIERSCLVDVCIEDWRFTPQMIDNNGGVQEDATSRVHLSVHSLLR